MVKLQAGKEYKINASHKLIPLPPRQLHGAESKIQRVEGTAEELFECVS